MSITHAGPEFQIESDRAIIGLGFSERKETGEAFASALDEFKLFEKIEVVTNNRAAAWIGRASLRREMERSTIFGHSGFVIRVPRALQIVAINAPEAVSFGQLIKRANDITKDPIEKEPEAHETGVLDLIKAGIELIRSPINSVRTPLTISRGYSAAQRLAAGAEDFPAGRALVHSSLDGFGFSDLADMEMAASKGVTTVMLHNHYHNEILFAPKRTLQMISPLILPEIAD